MHNRCKGIENEPNLIFALIDLGEILTPSMVQRFVNAAVNDDSKANKQLFLLLLLLFFFWKIFSNFT